MGDAMAKGAWRKDASKANCSAQWTDPASSRVLGLTRFKLQPVAASSGRLDAEDLSFKMSACPPTGQARRLEQTAPDILRVEDASVAGMKS